MDSVHVIVMLLLSPQLCNMPSILHYSLSSYIPVVLL